MADDDGEGTLWNYYSDYRGKMVPKDIFNKVLELGGLRVAQWEGKRKTKLGQVSTDYLEAWMANKRTEEVADGVTGTGD